MIGPCPRRAFVTPKRRTEKGREMERAAGTGGKIKKFSGHRNSAPKTKSRRRITRYGSTKQQQQRISLISKGISAKAKSRQRPQTVLASSWSTRVIG